MRFFNRLCLVTLMGLCGVLSGCGKKGAELDLPDPVWPEADSLCRQDPHWLGADSGYSVDLGNDRVLWLYGDTFLDPQGGGDRRDSIMVNNTIGIQTGMDPTTADMQFYWGDQSGSAAAFFPGRSGGWRWPLHGARLNDVVILFFMDLHAVSEGLGFEVFGSSAAIVENPDAEPADWIIRWHDVPTFGAPVMFGSGVVKDADYLYAYVVREPGNHDAHLVRWPLADARAGHLLQPEWWVDSQWVSHDAVADPTVVIPNAGTEFTVHYDNTRQRFIYVSSIGFGSTDIGIRTASAPEGPWTEPVVVFRPAESDLPELNVYAGKAHPELDGPDLIVTYAANAWEFADLIANPNLYWPRFVTVQIPD